jgi:hypothetical protein
MEPLRAPFVEPEIVKHEEPLAVNTPIPIGSNCSFDDAPCPT